jgi:hypothetical protein
MTAAVPALRTIAVTRYVTPLREGGSLRVNPLRQAHYMLASLAVGGTSGGDPSSTAFPARFEIDCIRVY